MTTYKYRCIGRGITDSQGIAHITHDCEGNPLTTTGYKGVGAGIIDFVASTIEPTYMDADQFQSNVQEVVDAFYYDPCTSDTTSNYSTSHTKTFTGSSIQLKLGTGTNKYIYRGITGSQATAPYVGRTLRFTADVIPSNNVRLVIAQSVANVGWSYDYSDSSTESATLSVDAEIGVDTQTIHFRIEIPNGAENDTVDFNNFTVYQV